MKVELEWRPRGNHAALVLKRCERSALELTVYVLDPALGRDDRRRWRHARLVDAILCRHADGAQPAYLCLLGSAGPPLFGVSGPSPGTLPPSLETLFQDPPAFGRWWLPSRKGIAKWRQGFANCRLAVRVLLNHHQTLPIDWDGLPDGGPDASIMVVADGDIPVNGGCPVVSWAWFEADMHRSDTVSPRGYAPRIGILGHHADGLTLAPEAGASGWTLTPEDDCTILAHRDFRMPQGEKTVTLAILDAAAAGAGLPNAVFDRPMRFGGMGGSLSSFRRHVQFSSL